MSQRTYVSAVELPLVGFVQSSSFLGASDFKSHFLSVGTRYVCREACVTGSSVHYETRKYWVEKMEDEMMNGKIRSIPQRKLKLLLQLQFVLGYRFRAIQYVIGQTILSW